MARKSSGTTPLPKGGGKKFPSPNTSNINPPPFPPENRSTAQLHQRHGSGSKLSGAGQHEQGARGKGKGTSSANTRTSVAFGGQSKPF
jgi:hypothetical protein